MKIEIDLHRTLFGFHDGKGSVVACNRVLKYNYPGDDWNDINKVVLIVSTDKFKGSIKSSMGRMSPYVKRNLGIVSVYNELTNVRVVYKPIYWAIEVYED